VDFRQITGGSKLRGVVRSAGNLGRRSVVDIHTNKRNDIRSKVGIMASILIAIALVVVCIFSYARVAKDKSGVPYRLPPGPKGLPIVGNTFQIPAANSGPVLARLATKYGEMYDQVVN
jgi:hypothetical protein